MLQIILHAVGGRYKGTETSPLSLHKFSLVGDRYANGSEAWKVLGHIVKGEKGSAWRR
jgi:hypothetical protein